MSDNKPAGDKPSGVPVYDGVSPGGKIVVTRPATPPPAPPPPSKK